MEKNTFISTEQLIVQNNNNTGVSENPIREKLSDARYRLYYDYLEWLGFSDDPNVIVLAPNEHYYYDDEDLRHVSALVNLKQLNYIRELKDFLTTVFQMLPHRSFFVGSFIERKHQFSFFSNPPHATHINGSIDPVENGIASRIPLLNIIYDFIDSRTNNRNLTRKSVTTMLEIAGFRLLDMTEINGITCFCAQKNTLS
ncbi:MAG TPA: hypothetical protein VK155_04495 [Bacteroidales bacterium]|jgi:hypothetical protein|nr:hypothetical protein [Bacteroidales bacterium]